jgi:hypothetical protein
MRILVTLALFAMPAYAQQADVSLTVGGANPDCGAIAPLRRTRSTGRLRVLLSSPDKQRARRGNRCVGHNSITRADDDRHRSPSSRCVSAMDMGRPVVFCSFPSLPIGTSNLTVLLSISTTYGSPFVTATASVQASTADALPANNSASFALRTTLQIPTLQEKTLALLAIGLAILALAAIRSA